jgi:hypothetical protein
MSITIIGISGKKKSGKNTLAKQIAQLSSGKVRELSFAKALKEEVAAACRVTLPYIEENKDCFRLILQGWGTDYKRKLFGDDYWTVKMSSQIESAINDNVSVVVITDVRFKNEYKYLNQLGAVLIRISRPEQSMDAHPSETDLDKVNNWHHIIINNGTIEDLIPQTKELLVKAKIKAKL